MEQQSTTTPIKRGGRETIPQRSQKVTSSRKVAAKQRPTKSRPLPESKRSVTKKERQLQRRTHEVSYQKRYKSKKRQQKPLIIATQAIPLRQHRKKLALLLPGHNEELIIAATIKSAIAAGQSIQDIYVVDDGSDDKTREIAQQLLGPANVLSVERSGKALAVQQAIEHFAIVPRYYWLHVADADSIFSPNYFRIYRKKLKNKGYAVAVGFVQSMRGNWISTYRALTYTYSQHITRRLQSYVGMISVFPGPITSFRTDILSELDFKGDTLTEDFDITLQVHRKKLGKISYIPGAVNYTQDPQTLRDFCRQNLRWQRGFFQGVKKYRIGRRRQRIDMSLGFQMMQSWILLIQLFFLLPLIIISTQSWIIIPIMIAADITLVGATAIFSSFAAKRWNLIGSLPYFYLLRWIEVFIYFMAFFEIMALRRFNDKVQHWSTEGRRYALTAEALQDVAN